MLPVVRNIIFSQLIPYAGLGLCILLKPAGLDLNAGVSYYGIFRETFFPYALGLLGGAYCLIKAAEQLPEHQTLLRHLFNLFALLIVGIVITPYAAGRWVGDAHTACGTALFSLQLLLSCWLTGRLHYVWRGLLLICLELVTGSCPAVYLGPGSGMLLQTELLFQLAFGLCLTFSLQSLLTVPMRQQRAVDENE